MSTMASTGLKAGEQSRYKRMMDAQQNEEAQIRNFTMDSVNV